MTWRDGCNYEGVWINDEKHSGKLEYPDSVMGDVSSYSGTFKNDKCYGKGEISL